MQEVLINIALCQLMQYCSEQGIDPSGSHVKKMGRGFVYGLSNDGDERVFAQVTFTKNTVPQFWQGNAARERGTVDPA